MDGIANLQFDEYQTLTNETAVYPEDQGMPYCALGLCGESGEVAEKIKKIIRDDEGKITPEKREQVKKELGDVLWYHAQLCKQFGFTMSEVAQGNLDKLFSRKDRGQLKGDGDNR